MDRLGNKRRIRLNSDVPGMHKKEKATIHISLPKTMEMKFLGFDPLVINQNRSTFEGKVHIPIKLQTWYPKTMYGKKHNASLRLDKLEYSVGLPPFVVEVNTLGHYFESNKDITEDFIVSIKAWLMSPELLETSILEFTVTLIGEEQVSERAFYSTDQPLDNGSIILPIWSNTPISFKLKLKLNYDIREFERSIQKTLSFYTEGLRLAISKNEFTNLSPKYSQSMVGIPDPIIVPETTFELLEEAIYISKQTKDIIKRYKDALQEFIVLKPHISQKNKTIETGPFRPVDDKLFKRLKVLERVLHTYERISLKKLAKFLDIQVDRLELWLLSLDESIPIKISGEDIFIDSAYVTPSVIELLDHKFLEWEIQTS